MISNGTGNGAPRSADTPTDMTPPRYAVDGREPSVIARPASLDDLAAALRDAHAAGQAVIPWGAGSQMALGAMPSRYDVALDLSGLDAIVEHDAPNLTITAQAGARLSSLQAALAEAGQFLPLDPAYPEATIGGLIATDASGGWRLGYGTLRDLVLGVRLVLADGTALKLGGKTMKNVAGYDLIKLVVGSLGTLGVVAEATLRAYAHPPVSRTLSVFTFPDPDKAAALTARILDLRFGPTALDIFSSAEGAYIVLARLEGEPEAVDALAASIETLAHAIPWLRVQVTETAASQELWRAAGTGGAYWNGPQVSYAVVARVGIPIAAVGAFLADARALTNRFDVPRLVTMHAGSGAGYVHLGALRNQTTVEALAEAALALRAVAETHGGHVVLAAAPSQVKTRVPVWGPTAAPELMAEIKRQFDPMDTLNPGRFIVS